MLVPISASRSFLFSHIVSLCAKKIKKVVCVFLNKNIHKKKTYFTRSSNFCGSVEYTKMHFWYFFQSITIINKCRTHGLKFLKTSNLCLAQDNWPPHKIYSPLIFSKSIKDGRVSIKPFYSARQVLSNGGCSFSHKCILRKFDKWSRQVLAHEMTLSRAYMVLKLR